MKRFNPFTALLYLMLILAVILVTLLEELFTYLARLVKKIRRNYQYVIYGKY